MPWWSWVWAAVLIVVAIGGALEDVKEGDPAWYTALGLASSLACITFVANYFGLLQLGRLTVPAAITLVWLVYEIWRDVQNLEESWGVVLIGMAIVLGLHVPATVLGMWEPLH